MITYRSKAWLSGIAILIFVFIVNGYIMSVSKRTQTDFINLADHWTVSGDLEYTDVNLDELVFDQVDVGDQFVCTCVLPEQLIASPVLRIYTVHYAVRIYLDDELLYEYGWDRIEQGKKMIGYGFHIIPLPDDYMGRTLRMEGLVTSKNAFTNINVPRICPGSEAVKRIVVEHGYAFFIVCFLEVFGIVLILVGVVFSFRNQKFTKLVCIGAFSLGITTWSLCSYDMIYVFSYNLLTKAYLEYLSLYVCPIPFLLYFYDDVMRHTKAWIRGFYFAFLYAQIIFVVVALILHFSNVVAFPDMLMVDHLLLFCSILYIIFISLYDIYHKIFRHYALLFALAAMLLFGLIDLIRFNIEKYLVWFQGETYVSSLYMGTFLFICAQIVDFCSEVSKSMHEAVETETLARLAYTDSLTGIANRRRCEEEMENLEKRGVNYGIFSFDLNNLKKANDSLGHDQGDKMICQFTKLLVEVFKEGALVGRMGGDEFIVIIPDADVVDVGLLERQLQEKINESKEQEIPLSTAYGYCERNEFREMESKDIYRKADARMYEMKQQMKK